MSRPEEAWWQCRLARLRQRVLALVPDAERREVVVRFPATGFAGSTSEGRADDWRDFTVRVTETGDPTRGLVWHGALGAVRRTRGGRWYAAPERTGLRRDLAAHDWSEPMPLFVGGPPGPTG